MYEKYFDFLRKCVSFIGEANSIQEKQTLKTEIETLYFSLNSLEKQELFQWFYDSCKDDPKLYTLIMSSVFHITKEQLCISELIRFISSDKMSIFDRLIVYSQLNYVLFVDSNLSIDYCDSRALHKCLLDEFERALDISKNYIPIVNRDKNKVVVMAQSLLTDSHAPTKIMIEICSLLQKHFGLEVILIIAIDETDSSKLLDTWYQPASPNHYELYNNKSFIINHNNEKINAYQFIVTDQNIPLMKSLIADICEIKPLFVWSMGSRFLFADIFRNYTTVISQGFSRGLPVSESDLLLEITGNALNDFMSNYLANNHQKFISIKYDLPLASSTIQLSRKDYHLSEDLFVVAIVGNRLNDEVTTKFLDILDEIIQKDLSQKIFFLFIGEYTNYESCMKERISYRFSQYIGYQDDLPAALKLTNLFLNPPRMGGGTSGLWSLKLGIPVITLDDCDIAYWSGSHFICNSTEDMVELVMKYHNDALFYQTQSKYAYLQGNNQTDMVAELTKLLDFMNTNYFKI